ncbi:MAG: hypothetical protein NZ772_00760 [Cyanobacteria bacterium]|nr:hypothetical protein [Cyanobacteriota bacterium]MDW8199927.1 hypothetical protein [Cyanobacteriota bacterium SKYGB_h_bin112]
MKQAIYCPRLPLAVYREVAAHLRQVKAIEVELLPQQCHEFDYLQSQVGGLLIQFTSEASSHDRARVDQILAYYGDRYGAWQPVTDACYAKDE